LLDKGKYSGFGLGRHVLAEMIERVLEQSIGKTVLIKLRGGRTLRGLLEGFDQHVNLVLKDAENISDPKNVELIGTIVLRGDNVVMISPPPS
jgi:small nuclear ribonucleoprotein